jgi:hypothetical protein
MLFLLILAEKIGGLGAYFLYLGQFRTEWVGGFKYEVQHDEKIAVK